MWLDQFRHSSNFSNSFAIAHSIKEDCVLAPTVFIILLNYIETVYKRDG